ncbi:PREDICTED: SAP30-binding protein isoform X2 [Poecilia mexicana]|uniref:SAP30-binding protein isoform X2 n=1 Tax=Poecilia mexicana TaxID=48701 RepID=UPI00072E17A1|nr:PREDICTED: SAP30-binding protein isoform X2 [Poecilia mexicana]
MASGKKSVLLSSLADYGDDSEPDSDPEPEDSGGHIGGLVYGYGDDDLNRTEDVEDKGSGNEDSRDSNSDMDESDEGRDADDVEASEEEKKDPNELVALFSEKVRNMSPDEIRIPPEPAGRCSSQLQEKIYKLYERKIHGDFDTNNHIQKKKEFRNPSIYEKLIQFCGIDELGTNYPKDMFDPHGWSEDSYYEALAKAQKVEMDKLEKAKKERTKVSRTKKKHDKYAVSLFCVCVQGQVSTSCASFLLNDLHLKQKSPLPSLALVTAQPSADRVCHGNQERHQPFQHSGLHHQQQHHHHRHRRPEEEKQVGLGDPRHPGPAHPHHHHGHPSRRRVGDHHG